MTKILYLSAKDVHKVGGDDPCLLVPAIEKALGLHALGDYSQPLKPYLKIPNDRLNRRIVSMPAYLGGEIQTWGIKVIASCPDNPQERGIPRASAVIMLHDVETGVPYTIMEGAQISAARTVAMAIISCKFLARRKSRTLAVLGAGLIGGLTARSLLAAVPTLERIKVYDRLSEKAGVLCRSLSSPGQVICEVSAGPRQALEDADIVFVSTTAQDGYIEGDWLSPGCLFLNFSLRDPKLSVVERSDKVVVDDWEQCNRSNTVLHKMYEAGRFGWDDVYAEISQILSQNKPGRESEGEIIFVNPMGMAIEDVAAAWWVRGEAKRQGCGTELEG